MTGYPCMQLERIPDNLYNQHSLRCANVPVYGLVFLFKWDKEVEDKRELT